MATVKRTTRQRLVGRRFGWPSADGRTLVDWDNGPSQVRCERPSDWPSGCVLPNASAGRQPWSVSLKGRPQVRALWPPDCPPTALRAIRGSRHDRIAGRATAAPHPVGIRTHLRPARCFRPLRPVTLCLRLRRPAGLHVRVTAGEGVRAIAQVNVDELYEGAPGLAHGGVLAAALDEVLGYLAWMLREPTVTAPLETRFGRPVPVGSRVHIAAECLGVSGRKVFGRATGRPPTARTGNSRCRPRRC